jgi:membrane dipeptidase
MRDAGFDVASLNVGFGPQPLEQHLRMLAAFRRWFAARPDRYALAATVGDVDAAREAGKLAIVFDMEGMAPLDGGDHGLVELLHDLGVRWMLIAYNRANAAGGGCYDEADGGLTPHGRAVLAEMRRVGMAVCCSHTGHRTARDVMEHAGAPVIFSHSNPAAVHPHPRNIPDDLIRACAATGGVVGVNGIGPFLRAEGAGAEMAAETWAVTLARHVDHVVQITGPEHAGLALDYVFDGQELLDYLATMRETFPDDATYRSPPGMAPPETLESLVEALLARGYAQADVAMIIGGNWRRVAAQTWR